MNITDDTKLTQRANFFGDGKDGYFAQEYSLYADGQETVVNMLVTGNIGKDNTIRKFTVGDTDFDNAADAFSAACHNWERSI